MRKALCAAMLLIQICLLAACGVFGDTVIDANAPHLSADEVLGEREPKRTAEELAEQERRQEEERRAQQREQLLSEMTLQEKIGQLFFLRCPAEGAPETIAQYHLGGILLFTRDYKDASENWLTRDDFCAKLDAMQSAARDDTGIPLFIGSDEEGGTVTRASRNPNLFAVKFPSPQQLYRASGMKGLLTETLQYNDALRALGINVNLAPVCDVTSGEGQFMYERSFGEDAAATAEYISQVVGVMKQADMACALKHFPGYGDNVDTHTGIAVDTREYAQFQAEDFLPFAAGISALAPFVMINHNIVTCMDEDLPATLSSAVHTVLREELGFEGVILTDDLDMDAVKEYAQNSNIGVLAIAAGNDMLVCSDLTQIAAIAEAVESGALEEESIDNACRRVLAAKQSLGLL